MILFIEKGQITERGSYEELIKLMVDIRRWNDLYYQTNDWRSCNGKIFMEMKFRINRNFGAKGEL